MGFNGTKFSKHIVIIGWDNFSRLIAQQLINASNKVAVVVDNKDEIDKIYDEFGHDSMFVLFADYENTSIFSKMNIEQASTVFVNVKDDTAKLILILKTKKEFGDFNFLVALENGALSDTFKAAGVSFVLSKDEIASKLVASYIFEPQVADFNNDLLSASIMEDDCDVKQYLIKKDNLYVNKTFGEVFHHIRTKYNSVCIGISRKNGAEYTIYKLPPDNLKILEGDYLIIILKGSVAAELANDLKCKEGFVY